MDISQKDIVLLILGAAIGYIVSWLFYKLPFQPLASYYLKETNEFYFEYINGFRFRKYQKRDLNGSYKMKISKKDFEKVKKNLVRRVVDC